MSGSYFFADGGAATPDGSRSVIRSLAHPARVGATDSSAARRRRAHFPEVSGCG